MFEKSFLLDLYILIWIHLGHEKERKSIKATEVHIYDSYTVRMVKNIFKERTYAKPHVARPWGWQPRVLGFHRELCYYSKYLMSSKSLHISTPWRRIHQGYLGEIYGTAIKFFKSQQLLSVLNILQLGDISIGESLLSCSSFVRRWRRI